jgi:ribosomal-protein-alanine N-acetyltransferase
MMSPSHIDSVAQIERQSFSSPWSRESFEAELENGHARYIVALEGGEVVGYAGYWRIFEEAHVTNVAVSPAKRGLGYGKAIMKELMGLAVADGALAMTLEVRVSNVRARGLYESLGFSSAGTRPKYYEDNGEDAMIMWNWRLKAAGVRG